MTCEDPICLTPDAAQARLRDGKGVLVLLDGAPWMAFIKFGSVLKMSGADSGNFKAGWIRPIGEDPLRPYTILSDYSFRAWSPGDEGAEEGANSRTASKPSTTPEEERNMDNQPLADDWRQRMEQLVSEAPAPSPGLGTQTKPESIPEVKAKIEGPDVLRLMGFDTSDLDKMIRSAIQEAQQENAPEESAKKEQWKGGCPTHTPKPKDIADMIAAALDARTGPPRTPRKPSLLKRFAGWASPRIVATSKWSAKWLVGKPVLYVMDSVGRHFLATGAGVFAGHHYGGEIIAFVTGLLV